MGTDRNRPWDGIIGEVDFDQDIVIPQCRLRHLAKPQSVLASGIDRR